MNAKAVYNAVPKRSVVPDKKSLSERNPYVVDDQVPTPEISDIEVRSSLY